MPYKDKAKSRAYIREYQRVRRAGLVKAGSSVVVRAEDAKNAAGLLEILSNLIREVVGSTEADVYVRARCAAYLISIGLRAVEVADIEKRITDLEHRIYGGLGKD